MITTTIRYCRHLRKATGLPVELATRGEAVIKEGLMHVKFPGGWHAALECMTVAQACEALQAPRSRIMALARDDKILLAKPEPGIMRVITSSLHSVAQEPGSATGFYTTRQAAQKLAISDKTLLRMLKTNPHLAQQFGPRTIRFKKVEIDALC